MLRTKKRLLQALPLPIFCQLLDGDHLAFPVLCKSEAVVSSCHPAFWIIGLQEFAYHPYSGSRYPRKSNKIYPAYSLVKVSRNR
jgi:hypothetical protein